MTPEHYDGWVVGDFIDQQELDFNEGNIIKYVCRYKNKDGLKDLLKARDYLNRIIDKVTQRSNAEPPF